MNWPPSPELAAVVALWDDPEWWVDEGAGFAGSPREAGYGGLDASIVDMVAKEEIIQERFGQKSQN